MEVVLRPLIIYREIHKTILHIFRSLFGTLQTCPGSYNGLYSWNRRLSEHDFFRKFRDEWWMLLLDLELSLLRDYNHIGLSISRQLEWFQLYKDQLMRRHFEKSSVACWLNTVYADLGARQKWRARPFVWGEYEFYPFRRQIEQGISNLKRWYRC